jgi:hypothetical protein
VAGRRLPGSLLYSRIISKQVHQVARKSFIPHRGKAEALRIRKLPRRFEYRQSLHIEARVDSK